VDEIARIYFLAWLVVIGFLRRIEIKELARMLKKCGFR